jgi:hypothetical protein
MKKILSTLTLLVLTSQLASATPQDGLGPDGTAPSWIELYSKMLHDWNQDQALEPEERIRNTSGIVKKATSLVAEDGTELIVIEGDEVVIKNKKLKVEEGITMGSTASELYVQDLKISGTVEFPQDSIDGSTIKPGTLSPEAFQESILSPQSIETSHIKDSAITSVQIANGTITQSDLSDDVFGVNSLTNNQLIKWDNTNKKFRNAGLVEVNGKIGIGTSSPSDTLDVSGSIKATTVKTNTLLNRSSQNFFKGGCSNQQTISGISSSGTISCRNIQFPPQPAITWASITPCAGDKYITASGICKTAAEIAAEAGISSIVNWSDVQNVPTNVTNRVAASTKCETGQYLDGSGVCKTVSQMLEGVDWSTIIK